MPWLISPQTCRYKLVCMYVCVIGVCFAAEVEFKCRMRKLQLENLVKDQYCPGAIQSTIDCEEDFNEMSFRLVFGCDPLPCTLPTVEPISILEAFAMRVELERCLLAEEMNYAEPRRSSRRGSTELDE